jgi:hypothetical protein
MLRDSAFSNHVMNAAGKSGLDSRGFGSGELAICANVIATPCSVFHTVLPVRHSYVMAPSAHKSAR